MGLRVLMGAFGQLSDLIGLRGPLSDTLLMGVLVLMRIVPIIFQTPFLGGKLVPPETRIGLSVGLAVLVFPFAKSGMDGPLDVNWLAFLILLLKELFLGFVIGFVATELFLAMEIAGRGLDVLRGSNMAEVQVPELQLRVSPIGQFNFQLLLVVFCGLNGHGHFIESVIKSYEMVSIDKWPGFSAAGFQTFVDGILMYTGDLFAVAFGLVFPGMFAAFLVDVVFGMFNRIAPQLNAYFMAMGVKALSGLIMFMFAMSLMVAQMGHRLEESLLFIRRIVAFF
ncbi:MAG: flagellar biosynthetic protein FliR [Deltaproteobacteria bacterium]